MNNSDQPDLFDLFDEPEQDEDYWAYPWEYEEEEANLA